MSRALLPAVTRDAKRWGCDVTRSGRKFVVTLLGDTVTTVRFSDTNAELRAAHRLIAEATGQQVTPAGSKKARARARAQVDGERARTDAAVADMDRQITHTFRLAAQRRELTNRYFEVRDIERLMGA